MVLPWVPRIGLASGKVVGQNMEAKGGCTVWGVVQPLGSISMWWSMSYLGSLGPACLPVRRLELWAGMWNPGDGCSQVWFLFMLHTAVLIQHSDLVCM